MQNPTQKIVELEEQFWQSMVDKDTKSGQAMLADQCLLTGPMGPMKIDRKKYAEMANAGTETLASYKLSDVSVVFPTDDVAVIAYKVELKGTRDGKDMKKKCADASTWVKRNGDWKCSLHTEAVMN